MYGELHVRRLGFVRRARELGFSVEAVRELLALSGRCYAPCAEARQVATAHLEDVRAKLTSLRAMEASLAEILAQCDPEQGADCPLLDALREPLLAPGPCCGPAEPSPE